MPFRIHSSNAACWAARPENRSAVASAVSARMAIRGGKFLSEEQLTETYVALFETTEEGAASRQNMERLSAREVAMWERISASRSSRPARVCRLVQADDLFLVPAALSIVVVIVAAIALVTR